MEAAQFLGALWDESARGGQVEDRWDECHYGINERRWKSLEDEYLFGRIFDDGLDSKRKAEAWSSDDFEEIGWK